jgi:hypothetical protein
LPVELNHESRGIGLLRENHLDEALLRSPLGLDPRLRVDLKRAATAGMTHHRGAGGRLSRREFPTTERLESSMAAAAKMGFR